MEDTNKKVEADGKTFSFTFMEVHTMPPPMSGPNVYLLYDGSIAMGYLEREGDVWWLKSVNPVDNSPMEITASDIIGCASAAPRRGLEFSVARRGHLAD